MIRTAQNLTTTSGVPSAALRRYHQKNLSLAAEAIDSEPVDRRFVTSITMPTSPEKFERAKELILRFREELSGLLEDTVATDVYTLAIQLFPLTKRKST